MEKKEEQLREAAEKVCDESLSNLDLSTIDYFNNGSPNMGSLVKEFETALINFAKSDFAKQYHSSNDSVEGLREEINEMKILLQNASHYLELENSELSNTINEYLKTI